GDVKPDPAVAAASLDHGDLIAAVLTQPVGEQTAGRSRAADDVIESERGIAFATHRLISASPEAHCGLRSLSTSTARMPSAKSGLRVTCLSRSSSIARHSDKDRPAVRSRRFIVTARLEGAARSYLTSA